MKVFIVALICFGVAFGSWVPSWLSGSESGNTGAATQTVEDCDLAAIKIHVKKFEREI